MKTKERNFRRLAKVLRKKFPTLAPVYVYYRNGRMPRKTLAMATAIFYDNRIHHFIITVDSRKSEIVVLDSLLHEWAHVVSWQDGQKEVDEHDTTWAIAYSKIWTEIIK